MKKAFQRCETGLPEVRAASQRAGVEVGIQMYWRRKSLSTLY